MELKLLRGALALLFLFAGAALPAFVATAAAAEEPGAYRIDRLEPPHWYTGFKQRALQLLVYGPKVAELTPAVDYPGLAITNVERVQNPNYLFVNLQLGADVQPGEFVITFSSSGEEQLRHEYVLMQKNPSPKHAQGFSAADAIYLITPDRFANGNPGNDNLPDGQDALARDELFGRHGGDLQGIIDNLNYIGDMGFTAIWLNPVLENRMPESSYHGYASTDFYRVDARFGSNAKYRELVQSAKQKGIGVIMDMIVNHSGSEHWWLKDPPDANWLNHPQTRTQTSHQQIANVDIHASKADRDAFADGWFVPAMPDLNQRHPLLARYLIQNALWWIEYLGLSGIRMDTYPYPDKHFMNRWCKEVMAEYPGFNIVGEAWQLNPVIVSYWQAGKRNPDGYESYLPTLMDFPLQHAAISTLNALDGEHGDKDPWWNLYEALANDAAYPHPERLVVFPDNHDMSRIFTQVKEDYALYKMALVYFLTTRGAPQIYYGTEILMHNRASDSHGLIRSDFPGGWPGDAVNAFTGEGLGAAQLEAQSFVRNLLQWRKGSSVIHQGKLTHFIPQEGVYVYFRHLDSDSGGLPVMVAFNANKEKHLLAPARFEELLQGARSGREILSGESLDFREGIALPPRAAVVIEIGAK